MAGSQMTIILQMSDGTSKEIPNVSLDMTVSQFKRRIEGRVSCPVSRHRLIYRGRLLKEADNDLTLASCGVKDGHNIHFVKGGGGGTPASSPPPTPPPPAFPGGAGSMRSMMDSPMVQSMLQNPEMMRSLMESNPQLRALAESNPQLRHMLSDPELMRQV